MDALNRWSQAGKSLFGLLRDATLFGLLVLLVGCPAVINDRLQRTGLSAVEGPGFRWEREVNKARQQSLAAATQVEQVKQSANETLRRVEVIAAANPQIARQVAPIRTSLASTRRSLDRTSNQLASAVIRQQDLLDEASAQPTWIEGYALANQFTSEDQFRGGTTAQVAAPRVNVIDLPGPGARVVAILRQGTRVRVVQLRGINGQVWVWIERQ